MFLIDSPDCQRFRRRFRGIHGEWSPLSSWEPRSAALAGETLRMRDPFSVMRMRRNFRVTSVQAVDVHPPLVCARNRHATLS